MFSKSAAEVVLQQPNSAIDGSPSKRAFSRAAQHTITTYAPGIDSNLALVSENRTTTIQQATTKDSINVHSLNQSKVSKKKLPGLDIRNTNDTTLDDPTITSSSVCEEDSPRSPLAHVADPADKTDCTNPAAVNKFLPTETVAGINGLLVPSYLRQRSQRGLPHTHPRLRRHLAHNATRLRPRITWQARHSIRYHLISRGRRAHISHRAMATKSSQVAK